MRSFAAGIALAALSLVALPAAAPAESAAPSCAEGPQRSGDTVVGTPCADTIHVGPTVQRVEAGAGDDTIIAGPVRAVSECPFPGCHLELGSTVFEGGPGNDVVWGDRGNDILRGNGGNDWLWGGIGDDVLEGGTGNDKLSGGFGGDHVDGDAGNDFVRGDPTQDKITDSGPSTDVDTLSYATAATPGFGNNPAFPGNPPYPHFSTEHEHFPAGGQERGVYLTLAAQTDESGNNGGAPTGGGVDEVNGPAFERIIGSPFSDYIVGGPTTQAIYGGGGADVLIAAGGVATALDGGADGDDCVGGSSPTPANCESTAPNGPVTLRDKAKVSVGLMAESGSEYAQVYVIGSNAADHVTISSSGAPETLTVQLSGSTFDTAASAQAGCEIKSSGEAACKLSAPLDSVLVAGLDGNDVLNASALPATASLILLGGDESDELTAGNETDDTLVDGTGNDVLHGLAGDDGLVDTEGTDQVFGELGNDLILSTVTCEGDLLNGGPGRDNASWAKYDGVAGAGVEARLDQGRAGRPGAGLEPECPGGTLDPLVEDEDLEGSNLGDVLIGNELENQLLGHSGADVFSSGAATDVVLANNADDDTSIACGPGDDTALIDIRPTYDDPVPVECENVYESAPEDYRIPLPKPSPVVPPPPADVKPPSTRLTGHPSRSMLTPKRHRRVSFRFVSSEAGSTFRCKLDRRPYASCGSPRSYDVGLGRHAFRVFAIDAAGNRDPSPALYRFRLRRRRR
jgi:Ca2+-binding RTX toxin-like protein